MVIAMRNNNYLSLINFKVKLYRQRLFLLMNTMFDVAKNFVGVVNMVSRGVLERYVGCCNNGVNGVFKRHAE